MSKYFKCPECGEVSSASKWDETTEGKCVNLCSIESNDKNKCYYICPKCDLVVKGRQVKERTTTGIPVKVKKIHPDAVIPKYAHEGDAGFDLVAVEDVIIEPGETKLVPLGLAFEIPQGYEMQIRPRSGLSLKTKLRQSNCVGTIDAGYRGEVKAMFDNTDKDLYTGDIKINKGVRIAQGVLNKVPQAQFIEVDGLDESERGGGGFGSSGVRDEN